MGKTIKPLVPLPTEYPEDNGEPMSENTLQFKWIVLIKEGLEHVFRDDPNVFIASDLLWYPVKGAKKVRLAPDAMVAFGRPKGRRGSYLQWLEGGIAPQVVFEVLSPGNSRREMDLKREFYEQHGVEEYYEYDPDEGTLEGWLRVGDQFQRIAEMDGFVSPRLGIRFKAGVGPDSLTILGPDGEPFRTLDDHAQRSKEEKRRADAERRRARAAKREAEANRQRADEEKRQAQAERQRADRLAAKLRELGIDPLDD